MFYVHRLVAQAFISNIKYGFNVNHKDGDKSNNNIYNLEVITFSENSKHAYNNKLSIPPPPMKGSKHPKTNKLEQDILKIRDFYYKNGLKKTLLEYPEIAKSTLCKIVYRITWKHV